MKSASPYRLMPFAVAVLLVVASELNAGVLYSNLQGDYVSQLTSSYTVDKGSHSESGYSSNFDGGSTGVGDDYSVDSSVPTTIVHGVPSVQLTGISFYGGVTPSPGNPAGSLGVGVDAYFFTSSGTFYPQSINLTQFQNGVGLQTFTFGPAYVPSQGHIVFSPYLQSSFDGMTGNSTPPSDGELTLSAYFGGAPTVGTGNAAAFDLTDTNRNLSSVPAQANSPAYMDLELDGIVPSPEPTTFALSVLGSAFLVPMRRTRRPY